MENRQGNEKVSHDLAAGTPEPSARPGNVSEPIGDSTISETPSKGHPGRVHLPLPLRYFQIKAQLLTKTTTLLARHSSHVVYQRGESKLLQIHQGLTPVNAKAPSTTEHSSRRQLHQKPTLSRRHLLVIRSQSPSTARSYHHNLVLKRRRRCLRKD